MKWELGELDTFVGDVWELATQAIVAPIHSELRPAGQLGADIMRFAGSSVESEFANLDRIALGQILATSAGSLNSEKIIHIAVSTLARRPTIELFEEALRNALLFATHNSFRSIGIPAMYIDPGELTTAAVARTTVVTAMSHLKRASLPNRIVLVVPTDYVHKIFLAEIDRVRYGEQPA